jgi:tetratricopeptide (TPR) repeat protein
MNFPTTLPKFFKSNNQPYQNALNLRYSDIKMCTMSEKVSKKLSKKRSNKLKRPVLMKFTLATCLLLCITLSISAQTSIEKADKELEMKSYNIALKSYRSILMKSPNDMSLYTKIAECYLYTNQPEKAVEYYSKTYIKEGLEPGDLIKLGNSLMMMGEYDKAKSVFARLADKDAADAAHYTSACDFAKDAAKLSPSFSVKPLNANTLASDFAPAFYGNKLVFASTRTDIKRKELQSKSTWNNGAENQLFVATILEDGSLVQPKFLRSDLNNQTNEAPASFSPESKTVVYSRNNFTEGQRQVPGTDLQMSLFTGTVNSNNDWQNEKSMPINSSDYSTGFPCISADGNTIYFASDMPGGFGGFDIYSITREDDSWSLPNNLGKDINTQGNEITPYIAGNSLYFASDFRAGFGGFDCFRSDRIRKNDWKNAVHLGTGVNSMSDDYGLIYDSKRNIGYFVSNRDGGKGKEDIYVMNKATDKFEMEVVNATDEKPISGATLDFSACNEGEATTDDNGVYAFAAVQGLDCKVIVKKEGFEDLTIQVKTSGKAQKIRVELRKNEELYIGKIVSLKTKKPLEGVRIRATHPGSAPIETMTDAQGEYSLALLPNFNYEIACSKATFANIKKTIKTEDGSDRGILGITTLRPSITAETGDVANNGIRPATPYETSFHPDAVDITVRPRTKDTNNNRVKVKLEEDKDNGETPSIELIAPSEPEKTLYAIQLSSLPINSKFNTDDYAKAKPAGEIYTRSEKMGIRVRVGVFEDKASAEEAQALLLKEGYKNAFIVRERNDDLTDKILLKKADKPDEVQPKIKPTQPIAAPKAFKLRLATFKNADLFVASPELRKLGNIQKVKQGTTTAVLLGDFPTPAVATMAQEKAASVGYKDAYIVYIDETGKVVRFSNNSQD